MIKKRVLLFVFILLPIFVFSQNRNSISFGVGMVSDVLSDQNFSSLVFAGTGYNIGLAYERQLNEKVYLRGGFAMQTSEHTHEIFMLKWMKTIPGLMKYWKGL